MEGKTCPTCGSSRIGTRKQGSYCLDCNSARAKRWRDANLEYHRAYARNQYAKLKDDPIFREKRNARNREGRAAHPERHRNYILRTKYGMTPADYDLLVDWQGGLCALCRKPPVGDHILQVDHCHDKNEVRGLLCFSCNYALGRLGDSVDSMHRVLLYLENPPAQQRGYLSKRVI